MAAWSPHYWTFEVVPVEPGTFEPFVLDVPSVEASEAAHDRASRRAYFSAFSMLRELEPEEWQMFCFEGEARGLPVGMAGIEVPA